MTSGSNNVLLTRGSRVENDLVRVASSKKNEKIEGSSEEWLTFESGTKFMKSPSLRRQISSQKPAFILLTEKIQNYNCGFENVKNASIVALRM